MPRPIFQKPNPPLIAAFCAGAVASAASGETARVSAAVSELSLLVWASEEMFAGANWFRRLLGVSGAAVALTALVRNAGLRA